MSELDNPNKIKGCLTVEQDMQVMEVMLMIGEIIEPKFSVSEIIKHLEENTPFITLAEVAQKIDDILYNIAQTGFVIPKDLREAKLIVYQKTQIRFLKDVLVLINNIINNLTMEVEADRQEFRSQGLRVIEGNKACNDNEMEFSFEDRLHEIVTTFWGGWDDDTVFHDEESFKEFIEYWCISQTSESLELFLEEVSDFLEQINDKKFNNGVENRYHVMKPSEWVEVIKKVQKIVDKELKMASINKEKTK